MWDGYVNFYTVVSAGGVGAWWHRRNEHRIVLARLLFWVGLALFGGRGIFLLIVNYALVGTIGVLFVRIAAERLGAPLH